MRKRNEKLCNVSIRKEWGNDTRVTCSEESEDSCGEIKSSVRQKYF